MPHASDVSSNDEVKVYQMEGEGEDEQRSSAENLKEVKSSLVTEVAEKEDKHPVHQSTQPAPIHSSRADHLGSLPGGKPFEFLPSSPFGYVSPYHPHLSNGHYNLHMVNRAPLVPQNHSPSPLSPISFMMYNADQFQPPPAHSGIHIDPKTGIPRPPVFPMSRRIPAPVFSPDFSRQVPWHTSMYHMAPNYHSVPYPMALSPASLQSRFSPPTLLHPSSISHPMLHTTKIEMSDNQQDSRYLCSFPSRSFSAFNHHNSQPIHQLPQTQNVSSPIESNNRSRSEKKKSHIKKPLNAFMLFMKEQRPLVAAECTLKESAAINQILGKKWHNLTREEQSKYYEMARSERQIHMERYPGWTARDNYAINAKKKKRKRDKSQEGDGNNPKKCRARFGLDQQSNWCKPCRRKKKCVRYRSGSDNTAGESEDNIGSVGSVEAPTPDSMYGAETNQHSSDSDSGNGDGDSDFSMSSPPVPRSMDQVQSLIENGLQHVNSPPSQQTHHPLNVQHLSTSSSREVLPDLPTPPSTDSSTPKAPTDT